MFPGKSNTMKKGVIKYSILFLFIVAPVQQIFSQPSVFCIKKTGEQSPVYEAADFNSKILYRIDSQSFFYCDMLSGGWYSCQMPHVFESTKEGYLPEDKVQLFTKLSLKKQKSIITKSFNQYYQLLSTTQKDTIISSIWVSDSSYPVPAAQLYYNNTFYPLLESFVAYYKKTNDTANLSILFKLSSYTDGEFSQTMSLVFFNCYVHNKARFINQLNKIKRKEYFSRAKQQLVYGIATNLPIKLKREKDFKIETLVAKEVERIKSIK
jgi:hypothetical protein